MNEKIHRFWLAKYALAFSGTRLHVEAADVRLRSLIRVRSAGVSGASPAATASLSLSSSTRAPGRFLQPRFPGRLRDSLIDSR